MRISSLKRFFHFTKFARRLCCLSAFLLLTACSSQPKVAIVKYQPIFDFSQVKSYGLYQRDDEFSDWQLVSDAMRNGIELAIERAMDNNGLTLKDSAQADVIVTYYVVRQSRRSFKTYNLGVNYCSYCLTNSKTGTRAARLDIAPGSLVIDVVKPKHRRSVWRASYPLGIREKDTSLEVNDKIQYAVAAMLKQFGQTHTLAKHSA